MFSLRLLFCGLSSALLFAVPVWPDGAENVAESKSLDGWSD